MKSITYTFYSAMQDINGNKIKELRMSRRESQTQFWNRFGITQSTGSRFESGLQLPSAVNILLKLYIQGVIKDRDLLKANESRHY